MIFEFLGTLMGVSLANSYEKHQKTSIDNKVSALQAAHGYNVDLQIKLTAKYVYNYSFDRRKEYEEYWRDLFGEEPPPEKDRPAYWPSPDKQKAMVKADLERRGYKYYDQHEFIQRSPEMRRLIEKRKRRQRW